MLKSEHLFLWTNVEEVVLHNIQQRQAFQKQEGRIALSDGNTKKKKSNKKSISASVRARARFFVDGQHLH